MTEFPLIPKLHLGTHLLRPFHGRSQSKNTCLAFDELFEFLKRHPAVRIPVVDFFPKALHKLLVRDFILEGEISPELEALFHGKTVNLGL